MIDLSYQLYSARNHPPLSARLRELAALGYAQVEGYGGLYANADPATLRAELDALGLSMPTAHIGLDDLERVDETATVAAILGIGTIYCPAAPAERRTTADADWQALGEQLARLAEAYATCGIGFGWHNHDFEFRPTASGRMPLDILLGSGGLQWEADLAWVQRGGQEPLEWIDKYADRITAAHLKDLAPTGEGIQEDGWADVGSGTMAWPEPMRALTSKTKCRHFVVEHDKPLDAARSAERSILALRKMGY